MGSVTAKVSVQDQSGPTPLDSVLVQVFQSDGTTFVTQGVTGAPFASGEVEFTLFGDGPGVTYVIRMSRDGWRFPAGATQSISVTDPPTPDNDFGPYDALLGASGALVKLVVQDSVPAPVDGVRARIFTVADVYLSTVETGLGGEAAGEASLVLPGAASPGTEYIVRLVKTGLEFQGGPTQTISVLEPVAPPDTNIFDFLVTSGGLGQSTDPDLCKLSGVFVDQSLRPIPGMTLEFKPVLHFPDLNPRLTYHSTGDPSVVRDLVLLQPVKVVTNSEGFVELELPRGGKYEVHIQGFGHPMFITEFITVPDEGGFPLYDVLFPYVSDVQFGSAAVSIAVGEGETVGVTAIASNLQEITDTDFLAQLLEFESSDDSVATVLLSEDGEITVTGVGAGTATVDVTRVEYTTAPRRPAIPAVVVGTLDITVT